jgi:lysyl-tRNA synthetase class 2
LADESESTRRSRSGPRFGDLTIDYEQPFARVAYAELFERALGFPATDTRRARDEARRRHLIPEDRLKGLDDTLVVNELFEEVAEPTLDPARPTFVTDDPAVLSPLTRPRPENPAVADRADLFIGGMEIGPHYTELNDPDTQAAYFRAQLAGLDDEESTFRTFDEDFVRALKVGMPPAGGMGLGIDRLMMLLTNQRTIRDVILFPLMRPE